MWASLLCCGACWRLTAGGKGFPSWVWYTSIPARSTAAIRVCVALSGIHSWTFWCEFWPAVLCLPAAACWQAGGGFPACSPGPHLCACQCWLLGIPAGGFGLVSPCLQFLVHQSQAPGCPEGLLACQSPLLVVSEMPVLACWLCTISGPGQEANSSPMQWAAAILFSSEVGISALDWGPTPSFFQVVPSLGVFPQSWYVL